MLFKMFVIHVVRRRRRFECQGVDDLRNFTYIPAKPQPRHVDNIYYIFAFFITVCSGCGGSACGSWLQRSRFNADMSHFFSFVKLFCKRKGQFNS